jgi:hypothetical protein
MRTARVRYDREICHYYLMSRVVGGTEGPRSWSLSSPAAASIPPAEEPQMPQNESHAIPLHAAHACHRVPVHVLHSRGGTPCEGVRM